MRALWWSLLFLGLGFVGPQEAPARRPVAEVAAKLSQESGRTVLADATAAAVRVPLPTVARLESDADVEAALDALIESLPAGASWAKFLLPPAPAGHRWTGEEIAAYAVALARLYGKVGSVEAGRVEIFSRQVPLERARPLVDELGLRAVYLVTLRGARTFAGRWNATFGELTLEVRGNRVVGSYTTNDGTITGTLRGNRLDFVWFERANGTRGAGWFVLSDDGLSFTGQWGNDDEAPSRPWTGRRIEGRERL